MFKVLCPFLEPCENTNWPKSNLSPKSVQQKLTATFVCVDNSYSRCGAVHQWVTQGRRTDRRGFKGQPELKRQRFC